MFVEITLGNVVRCKIGFVSVVCAQKPSLIGKRPQPKLALAVSVKIKSQPKKARLESPPAIAQKEQNVSADEKAEESNCLGLVAYSDESDDE